MNASLTGCEIPKLILSLNLRIWFHCLPSPSIVNRMSDANLILLALWAIFFFKTLCDFVKMLVTFHKSELRIG